MSAQNIMSIQAKVLDISLETTNVNPMMALEGKSGDHASSGDKECLYKI